MAATWRAHKRAALKPSIVLDVVVMAWCKRMLAKSAMVDHRRRSARHLATTMGR